MLTKLIITNFRKHEDTEIDFTQGLNIIRGKNEGGKSTLGEALLYALYGARALRGKIDNVVTWGKSVNTLKVEAIFLFQGETYKFTRSKGGAEVYKGESTEPFITGQTEVATFASQLIGADLNKASALMVANQGNLRGALLLKPKETSEMVEDIADFSFFETLLESMQQKLILGSDVSAKTRLEQAQGALDELKETSSISQADIDNAEKRVSQYEKLVDEINEKVESQQKKFDTAKTNFELAEDRQKQLQTAKEFAASVVEEKEKRLESIKTLEASLQEVDTSNLESLKEQIREADTIKTRVEAFQRYEKFKSSINSAEAFWDDSLESLENEITKQTEVVNKLKSESDSLLSEIKDKKGRIITATDCSHCGQPIKNVDEVLANNEILKGEIEELSKKVLNLDNKVDEETDTLNTLKKIKDRNRPVTNFIQKESEYVEVDYGQVPHAVKWKGAVPKEGESVDDLKVQVAEIESQVKTYESTKTRISILKEGLPELEEKVAKAQKTLSEAAEVGDLVALEKAFKDAEEITLSLKMEQGSITHQLNQSKETLASYKAGLTLYESRKNDLEEQVANYKQEVQDLAFNNALIKKVRAARPVVSNQLWNLVLSSVSTMFSKVRGVQSTVTKEKEGFLVNGESVEGLSGSTLDLLGLAIRCSLIKLFIPNCPFLILDEPAAAMDSDRTASMMGFIQTLDFPQTILITHEDLSETMANNLIEL